MSFLRSLIWFIFATSPCWAAGLSLQLTPSQPVAGEPVEVMAVIEGAAGQVNVTQLPQSPGITVDWRSPSQEQSTTIVNGQMSRQFRLKWSGTATDKLGNYQITPIGINLDGQLLTSNVVNFKIGEQQTSQFYLLQTEVTPQEAVVGESVTLHLDLCFATQELSKYERYLGNHYELAAKHYDAIGIPSALEKDFHVHIQQGREAQNAPAWYGVDLGTRQINGYTYRVHRLSFLLEPKREGRLEIPALSQSFFQLNFQRDFFNRPTPVRQNRPIMAHSQAIFLNVIRPPLSGQPSTFNGQVCRDLKVELQIDELQKGQTVQLHSPLSLRISITSNLPASAIQAPKWDSQKALLQDFNLNSSAIIREDHDKTAVFSGIIARPKNKDLTELPPIVVAWFNAESRRYEESVSEPFPLKVEAVDDQTILESQAKEVLALKPATVKMKVSEHLHGLEIDPQILLSPVTKAMPWPWFLSLCSIGWLSGIWFCSATWRQNRNSSKAKKERFSAKQTLGFVAKAQSISELNEYLSRYLCARYKVKDPHEALKPTASQYTQLKTCLETLEMAGFSNQTADIQNLKTTVKNLIDQLEEAKS